MNPLIIGPVLELIGKGLDRWVPDPEQKAKAQIDMARMIQEGEFKEIETRMNAIIAEASSEDSWTSRARPSFLYVFYFIILMMVVVAPLIGVWRPEAMELFFINVKRGFEAIPEELWWTFSSGYLGYSTLRSVFDKKK